MERVDAVVVGSGPNGLVAATLLARAGWSVRVLERQATAGGAIQSAELTVPGYLHDRYSAFYGILQSSPVFSELGLDRRLDWGRFSRPVAAAVSPGEAAAVFEDPAGTAGALAARATADGRAWEEWCRWWERVGERFTRLLLSPVGSLRPALRLAHPLWSEGVFAFARLQLEPLEAVARASFREPSAQALFACGASHSDVAVDMAGSFPSAVVLSMVAQARNMAVPLGGSGRLAEALVSACEEAGAVVRPGAEVTRVVVERRRAVGVETADGEQLAVRRAVVCDVGPRALFGHLVEATALPPRYLDGLARFRYGTGIFKVDLACSGPVPWADGELEEAGVVHLTGDLDEMAKAAFEARHGVAPERPMLIVGQQSLADPSRAPKGCATLWVETHVPARLSEASWAERREGFLDVVLRRLEAHAPGLGSLIEGVAVRTPEELEGENPNLVGGDLGGGSSAIDQQAIFRPVPGWFRYRTPLRHLYLCSASTHPAGGVHGMAGRNAARRVLADARRRRR